MRISTDLEFYCVKFEGKDHTGVIKTTVRWRGDMSGNSDVRFFSRGFQSDKDKNFFVRFALGKNSFVRSDKTKNFSGRFPKAKKISVKKGSDSEHPLGIFQCIQIIEQSHTTMPLKHFCEFEYAWSVWGWIIRSKCSSLGLPGQEWSIIRAKIPKLDINEFSYGLYARLTDQDWRIDFTFCGTTTQPSTIVLDISHTYSFYG